MQIGSHPSIARQDGYAFVVVLAALALVSLGLARAGPLWADAAQRDKERELLRVGQMYAQALASYRNLSPGSERQFPMQLDALVLDTRFAGTLRHLRKLYPDPLNPGRPWGLVRDAQGRIQGVYSLSEDAPVAQGPLVLDGVSLAPARRYADWKFVPEVGR